ncbi:MAG: hypothetical protein AcusKO_38000 [Acuticoccus sp.]
MPVTEAPGCDHNDAGEDIARLARPRAQELRSLAAMLGARFAGDAPPDGPAADESPRPPADAKAAALLETLPLPLLVTQNGGVAFLNRAARDTLGYSSAGAMEAGGGLGALFEGEPGAAGTVLVSAADGRRLAARAEVTPIDWSGHRAGLLSLQPLATAPPRRPAPDADDTAGDSTADTDDLEALLSAQPDPIAIISRGGQVTVANAAYRELCGAEDLALAQRLEAGALEAILLTLGEAFNAPSRCAELEAPVTVGGRAMVVTVAIVRGEDLACVAFHPLAGADTPASAPPDAVPGEGAVARAVTQAAALVHDASVSIHLAGGAPLPLETEFGEETERFFRALLVFLGARATAGTRVTLTRGPWAYALTLTPEAAGVLGEVTASSRLVLFGLEAGLAIATPPEGGLSIAPLLTP